MDSIIGCGHKVVNFYLPRTTNSYRDNTNTMRVPNGYEMVAILCPSAHQSLSFNEYHVVSILNDRLDIIKYRLPVYHCCLTRNRTLRSKCFIMRSTLKPQDVIHNYHFNYEFADH